MIREKTTTALALLFLGLALLFLGGAWAMLQIGGYFERASDRAERDRIKRAL